MSEIVIAPSLREAEAFRNAVCPEGIAMSYLSNVKGGRANKLYLLRRAEGFHSNEEQFVVMHNINMLLKPISVVIEVKDWHTKK